MAFKIPSSSDLLNQYIQDYIAITSSQGFNVSPDPNSEVYARLLTIANSNAVTSYLISNAIQSYMLDTATGSDLDRLGQERNIWRQGATSASGYIQFFTASPQTIAQGALLTGPNSLQYYVAVSGVYANLQIIPVICTTAGSNTNLDVGQLLTWQNQPFNAQPTAPVYTVITGGSDQESDSDYRARILSITQYPPQAGNASQVSLNSAQVDPIIQFAFVYGNYNGAGTLLVALAGNQTTSYVGRDIPHLLLDNYLPGAKIVGGVPSGSIQLGLIADPTTNTPYNKYSYTPGTTPAYSVLKNTGPNLKNDTSAIYQGVPYQIGNIAATAVTTLNNIPVSTSIELNLPYPVGAPSNGFGGGWLNFTTWPNPDGLVVHNFCSVVSVSSSTVITINAASLSNASAVGPTIGVTKVQWVNRSNAQNTGWLINTATIIAATDNNNNTWTITLDNPFVFPTGFTDFYGNTGIVAGDYIFPASTNAQTYLTQIMQQFSLLGPGEMTTSTGLLDIGAARFPSSAGSFPIVIDTRFVSPIIKQNVEVQDANFVNDNAVFLSDLSNTFNTPPLANAPPNIFVPLNIGFYDASYVNYLG
jgi:hypothetical protein